MGANLVLGFVGLGMGLVAGGALGAFFSILKLITRLADRMNSMTYEKFCAWCVALGAGVFAFASVSGFHLMLPRWAAVIVGAFSGAYIGMVASALSEVLDVIPIFTRRLHITWFVKALLIALLLGKSVGSLFYWLFWLQ
ncbi:stage V sporulation protein AB [Gehongia tenuis]|uniref:Stage V sporulation protein AB n=1 Tax=Gehongia tenuis TaxID=2763655 RepID=A0A926D6P3_9FIRM|nr:stage V sporulation protein AB [Gehongia tenuis]MBC8532393.1 stage V sporulation protein AB [Gehongia tenuis]